MNVADIFVARTLAQKFQDRLGQPIVVLNKPGASGAIGAMAAARARPDGHTLYVGSFLSYWHQEACQFHPRMVFSRAVALRSRSSVGGAKHHGGI